MAPLHAHVPPQPPRRRRRRLPPLLVFDGDVRTARRARSTPTSRSFLASLQKPSRDHWFGTDLFGRDCLSRVIYGTRVSLLAGLEAVAIAVVLGTVIGTVRRLPLASAVDTVL